MARLGATAKVRDHVILITADGICDDADKLRQCVQLAVEETRPQHGGYR